MGWKKLILGDKMPDRDDPKYKQRYENEVEAGRKTAQYLKIDKAAGWIQRFACRHPKLFLAIVFGTVIGCFSWNVYRIVTCYNAKSEVVNVTATQHQEQILKQKQLQ